MATRFTISALPAHVLALNPSLAAPGAHRVPHAAPKPVARVNDRADAKPRQKGRKPPAPQNKAEAGWIEHLRRHRPDETVLPHAVTLVFRDGDRYTPDVLTVNRDGLVTLYEVKGGYRGPGWEQGIERFKRAVAEFPGLRLVLVDRRTDGLFYIAGGPVRGQEG